MRTSYAVLFQFCAVVAAEAATAQEKPQPLPTVPVTASAEMVRSAKLREFDRRRSNGIGRFLTEADLENDQHRQLSDVLRKLPGMVMVRRRSAVFVVSSRGSATIEHLSAVFGRNCPVAIWLDGVPVYRGLDRGVSGGDPAFGSKAPPQAAGRIDEPPFDINSIMTNHVAAIEFYAGPATMPPELNATQGRVGRLSCGRNKTGSSLEPQAYFRFGITNSEPDPPPLGHREVTVFSLVKNRTPSMPCWFWSPNAECFQPPKE